MIYVDSSALLKLLRSEAESAALQMWLASQSDVPLLSSLLAKVELMQACCRYHDLILGDAESLLACVNFIPLRTEIADMACTVGDPPLRSLDALHLASALSVRAELSAFCVYDQRLHEAATAAGLPAVAPDGQELADS